MFVNKKMVLTLKNHLILTDNPVFIFFVAYLRFSLAYPANFTLVHSLFFVSRFAKITTTVLTSYFYTWINFYNASTTVVKMRGYFLLVGGSWGLKNGASNSENSMRFSPKAPSSYKTFHQGVLGKSWSLNTMGVGLIQGRRTDVHIPA